MHSVLHSRNEKVMTPVMLKYCIACLVVQGLFFQNFFTGLNSMEVGYIMNHNSGS